MRPTRARSTTRLSEATRGSTRTKPARATRASDAAMRSLDGGAADYGVTILETVGSQADDGAVLNREAQWERKLGTRVQGVEPQLSRENVSRR